MKKELGYAFKRGSSRPIVSAKKESLYLQSIFSSRMLTAIHRKDFIINVDGSSFNRSIKNKYSWLPKGKSLPILNILWKGSANILLALSVDGTWFWMILNESNTHFTFWIFLFFLQNYVRLVWRNINFPIKLMLDNASIHLTRQTMNLAQYLKNGAPLFATVLTTSSSDWINLWSFKEENCSIKIRRDYWLC